MKRVALTTFGCKANQFDTAVLESLLRKKSLEIVEFDSPADFYVINSCAITAEAEREARQFVRRAQKQNPQAKVIVTGCSAQVSPEAYREMEVEFVVGNEAKGRVVEYIQNVTKSPQPPFVKGGGPDFPPLKKGGQGGFESWGRRDEIFYSTPDTYSHNSRAFLKIQDGCSQFCSFCIVPFARGLNRSVSADQILSSMHQLKDRGFQEIVLTGIHLGTYGVDLRPRTSLLDLMRRIESEKPVPRVRISSVDPEELTDEMIHLIADSEIFCHHLHLPMQSGDDGILKKMRRRYSGSYFAHLTEKVAKAMPDVCIGTDLIVGFPGEDEEAFEESAKILEFSPVHYVHTFPYSDRSGTKAAGFVDKVEPSLIRMRARRIRDLSADKRVQFSQRHIGKTAEVVVELRRGNKPFGLTRNYISVEITNDCHYSSGSLALVRIDSASVEGVMGCLVSDYL